MLIVPETLGQILVLLLVVAIAVDTTKSVQSALDMKELLTRMRESNATLAKIEDRIGELAESAEEYSQNIRERLRESEENVYERLYEASAQKQERRESFEELLALRKSKKAERIATLSRRADVIIAVMREGTNGEKSEKLEKALSELREFKDILKRSEAELMSRSSNEYRKVVSILRRNPTATSHENSSLLSTFRELTERKRK
jgi:alkanesulfonate monooxygenase SsuD/methylene tetrahydromethanopterin reductase-like flavin-dependent oxidoreductase (luciferase family)